MPAKKKNKTTLIVKGMQRAKKQVEKIIKKNVSSAIDDMGAAYSELLAQSPTTFRTNQRLKIKDMDCVIDGYFFGKETGVSIRIERFDQISKASETYLKQFTCQTPRGKLSRLYIIPLQELARQQYEQENKVDGKSEERTKSKR
jgi:hypothetical protein